MKITGTIMILLLASIIPAVSFAVEGAGKITVTGKSETIVDAHYAIISIGVRQVSKEMQQSHAELEKTVEKLTDVLLKTGLKKKDIKKSFFMQGQEYSWSKSKKAPEGYYSECQIDLKINSIKNLPNIYQELANHKSITIQNTEFRRNDEFEIRQAEFEKAIQAGKKKAEYMA